MSKDRSERRAGTAQKMLAHLSSAESMAEDAVQILGNFVADLPAMRAAADVSTTFHHPLYVELAGAMNAAVEMRGRLVGAHNILEAARQDLRLPHMMTAPGADKPPSPQQFARMPVPA